MRTLITSLAGISAVAILMSAYPVWAQVPPPPDGEEVLYGAYKGKTYSPYAQRGFPSRPLWGDTHLHTAMSWMQGRSATVSVCAKPIALPAAKR